MIPQIGSSLIIIDVPRDAPCQNMDPLWQKHGPNMVLQIGSSLILIFVPRAALLQISHCWVYPVTPFPKNGQNMTLFSPNLVLTWAFNWSLPEYQSMFPGMLHAKSYIDGCIL